jgi:hypothetical protein
MDGRVLTEAFSDAFNAEHPVIYSGIDPGVGLGDDSVFSEDEEEQVLQKLRDLGYVA